MAKGKKKKAEGNGELQKGLDFEKPILELEQKIAELENLSATTGIDLNGEIKPLKERCAQLIRDTFSKLTPWQKVNVARHPKRPSTEDYVSLFFEQFVELHGDRSFGDDPAMLCGLAFLEKYRVVLIGHQKGRTIKEKVACNFGCPHPEGYRKALLKMKLAEKFHLPLITFINTQGAYPGIGAEERGQSMAIAQNLFHMSKLRAPILCVVLGEGGSGGALAIGIADRICMLEHSYYSVITPEGCAAILWKDGNMAPNAAEALKLTSQNLLELGVVDEVISEPLGGAHRNPQKMAKILKESIMRHLDELTAMPIDDLMKKRYQKFRKMGFIS